MSNYAWFGLVMAASLLASGDTLARRADGPDRAVWAAVEQALDAAASGDVKALRQAYLPESVFVDEFAPFEWSGAHSLDAYLASAAKMYKNTGMSGTKVVHGPPGYIYVAGENAYLTVPLHVTASAAGKPYSAQGVLTFALRKTMNGWKISSQAWSKLEENRSP